MMFNMFVLVKINVKKEEETKSIFLVMLKENMQQTIPLRSKMILQLALLEVRMVKTADIMKKIVTN